MQSPPQKRNRQHSPQGIDDVVELASEQIAGMGLMGLGGLISIIGGVIFLVVVYLAIRPEK